MVDASDDNVEPVKVGTNAKSPEDLESEIAATAAALGGKSKKEKAAASSADNEPKAQEQAESKSEPAKEAEIEAKDESGAEADTKEPEPAETKDESPDNQPADNGQKIEVKKNNAADAEQTTVAQTAAQPDSGSEEKPTLRRSGKTILPLSQQGKEMSDAKKEEASKPETTSDDESKPETETAKSDTSGSSENSEAARKLDAMSGELKARDSAKKAEKANEEQQAAKVYDTKKYHLPIKAGHHHRRSMMPTWLQVLILLLALAGAAYYALATDIISFGGSSFLDESSNIALEERPIAYANTTGVSLINLLESAENIGSAQASVSVLFGDSADSPVLTTKATLEQNRGGSFWLVSDETALEAVNNSLKNENAAEREYATAQQTLDFLDVYGFSTLIADSSVGSLNSLLKNLTGSKATECQSAIDSAIVAMSDDSFKNQKLEKNSVETVSVRRGGQDIEAEQFTLDSPALDTAKGLLEAAADACGQSTAEASQVKSTLPESSQIVYTVSDGDIKFVKVDNQQLGRTLLDIELGSINQTLSEDTPDRMINFNSPVAKSLAAYQACGELANNVEVSGPTVITPGDDDYLTVVDPKTGLACGSPELSGDENLLKKLNQLLSLKSLVESLGNQSDGYPLPVEITASARAIDSWIPDLTTDDTYDYSLTPNGCGDGQICTGYQLQPAN